MTRRRANGSLTAALFCVSFAALLAGCGSAPTQEEATQTPQSNATPVAPPPAAPAATDAQPQPPEQTTAAPSPLPSPVENTLVFSLNKFNIKPEYDALLFAYAQKLTADPASRLTLAGYADDRKSAKANLELGKKRAEAVRRAFVRMGVPAAQIEIQNPEAAPPLTEANPSPGPSPNSNRRVVISVTVSASPASAPAPEAAATAPKP